MKFDDTLEIERAMVIYAHPDDAEFGSSATVAKWAKAGVEITYVMVTNGGSGSSDPKMTRPELVSLRKAEQQAAADLLGVARVCFLGFEDGSLEVTPESRKAVAREIRRYRPDVIISTDPTMRYREGYVNHPDHIAVGEIVMRSINPDASTRLMFPELAEDEGLEPHLPKALFLVHWGDDPGHVEDVSDTIDMKIEALGLHASQVGDWDYATFMRERAAEIGTRGGYAAGEQYQILRLES